MELFQLLVIFISGLIFIIIFYRYLDLGNLKRSFSIKSVLISFGLSLLLWNADVLLSSIGSSIGFLKVHDFSFEMVLLIGIIVPFIEEMVSRIILINRFIQFLNPVLIILSTSLFFSVLHIGDLSSWASSFFYGLVMGGFYVVSRNGVVLILTHIIYNTIYLLLNSVLIDFNHLMVPYYYSIWHYFLVISSLTLLCYLYFKTKPRLEYLRRKKG